MNAPWDRVEIVVVDDVYGGADTILGGRVWPRSWWSARKVRKALWGGYGVAQGR